MRKILCGLMVALFVLCGIFATAPSVDAMMKSTGIVRKVSSVTVTKDGDKFNFKWQYQGLEGTKVKINLYENGQLKRTIAENISIGQNGSGSWDWGNRGTWDDFFVRGKEYKIEIVSMTDSNLRIMSDKIDDDHSR